MGRRALSDQCPQQLLWPALCGVQDVAMLCAPRVLEFDMQWKRNAMPCRRGGEGSHRSAKGRSAKMRLRIASHVPPVRGVPCTSLVVLRPDCLLAVRRRK